MEPFRQLLLLFQLSSLCRRNIISMSARNPLCSVSHWDSPSLSCHGGSGCERTRSPQTCPSAFPHGASSGSPFSPSLVTWACTGYDTHTEARRQPWGWSSPFHLIGSCFLLLTTAHTRLAGLITFTDSLVSASLPRRSGVTGVAVPSFMWVLTFAWTLFPDSPDTPTEKVHGPERFRLTSAFSLHL